MINPLQQLREGISRVESGGNYNVLGPEISRKSGTDRAYGKYQVMGANIPQWTEQALGRKLTPMEFLRSPEAQEAVFENQMMKNLQKYGTLQDAASVWFTGRPLVQAQKAGAHDVNMGVGDYVRKALGGNPDIRGEMYAQVTPMPEDAPLTMQDFFEGKHKEVVKPQNQMPVPKVYAPEDFFTGNYKKEALPQQQVEIPSPAPQPEIDPSSWNMKDALVRGAVSGFTGGLGNLPKATATVKAGYDYLTGANPDFMENRRQYVEGYENERKEYEQENPMTSEIATSVGGGLGALVPMGIAAKGIGAAANVASRIAPRIAPAVNYAGEFLAGRNPALLSIPSRAAAGAIQGVGTTALTQDLVPEEDRGRYGLGAALGAGGNVLFGAIGSPLAKVLKSELNENLVPLAQKVNKKFGLDVRAGQVAKDAEIKKLDETLVPQHVHDAQLHKFSDAIAKELEMPGKSLSDTHLSDKIEEIGKEIRTTVEPRTIPTGSPAYKNLVQNVNKIFNEVEGKLNPGDPEVPLINNFLKGLRTAFASGQMDGPMIQNYIGHNGRIANAFRNTGRAALNGVDHDLREAFLDAFEKAHPNVGARFKEARQLYKKLAAVDTIVAGNESGVIDPQKLMRQVRKRNITGSLEELAKIGQHMPRATASGSAQVRGPSGLYRNAATVAAGVSPVLRALGFDQSFGELASKAVTGEIITDFLQSQLLKNRMMNNLKLNYPGVAEGIGQNAGNVLRGPGVAFGTGVGGQER